jgi:hypothetical protein
MTMRTLLYVLFLACLVLLLLCVNLVRWLIAKYQLALLSFGRWPTSPLSMEERSRNEG